MLRPAEDVDRSLSDLATAFRGPSYTDSAITPAPPPSAPATTSAPLSRRASEAGGWPGCERAGHARLLALGY